MADRNIHNARVLDKFARQAESYAALINRSKDTTLPILLEAVKPLPTERMLDVGCGTGRFAVSMAPLLQQVTGIDLTAAMLQQAAQLQVDAGIDNIDWHQGDVKALPFADGEFDIVSCRAMLHHVVDPARVMAEMCRVCKPGGRIVATDLTPSPDKSAAFDAIEILRDPSHTHALTNRQLRDIGEQCRLAELAVYEYASRQLLNNTLHTSFPDADLLERIRELYRIDALSGANALGFNACIENDEIVVAYPMSMVIWQRRA